MSAEEQLRQDFPVDWEEDHFVSRREFFKFMTLASGVVAAGTTALAAYGSLPRRERSFEPSLIAKLSDLPPGSAKPFNYPRPTDICLLVHTKSGGLVAYSRRCTHLSCPVSYQAGEEGERFYCPCHSGSFAVEDGRVLQGPPPHPLSRIKLEQRGDEIWATGVQMGEHR